MEAARRSRHPAHEPAVAARLARRADDAARCAAVLRPPLPRRIHDRREREQLE